MLEGFCPLIKDEWGWHLNRSLPIGSWDFTRVIIKPMSQHVAAQPHPCRGTAPGERAAWFITSCPAGVATGSPFWNLHLGGRSEKRGWGGQGCVCSSRVQAAGSDCRAPSCSGEPAGLPSPRVSCCFSGRVSRATTGAPGDRPSHTTMP